MKLETYVRMSPENAKINVYKVCGDVNDGDLAQSHEMTDVAADCVAATPSFVDTTKIFDGIDYELYKDLIPFAVVIPECRRYKILFANKITHEIFHLPAVIYKNTLRVMDQNDPPAAMKRFVTPRRTGYKYDFFTTADIVCMLEYHNAHAIGWSVIHGLIIHEDARRVLGW